MKISTSDSPSSLSWLQTCGPNGAELASAAIDLALREDLGQPACDLTSDPIVDSQAKAKARIYSLTNNAVIAGIPVVEYVLHKLDANIAVTPLVAEGARIKNTPAPIVSLFGGAKAILTGERIALNLLQRMCAVATATAQFTEKAKQFNIAILDTRKTTPGLRVFERYAVLTGGGQNHRFGLNDAILVKDNHIQIAGGITKAVTMLRTKYPDKPLEVECTTMKEVQESLDLSVEKIMLDNMSPASIKEAVSLINGKSFIEISGGVNMSNIDNYLLSGVNAISIGAITHSAPGIDINLEFED